MHTMYLASNAVIGQLLVVKMLETEIRHFTSSPIKEAIHVITLHGNRYEAQHTYIILSCCYPVRTYLSVYICSQSSQ